MFVQKNAPKWKRAEDFLQGKLRLTPDELANYYVDIIADLSYARTFYPQSKIVDFLNQLSGKIHRRIYKTKREERGRFGRFWKVEIPLAIKGAHRELFFAALIFIVSIAVGIISSYMDIDFPRLILGDQYVDMTLDNIQQGDPFGVYKSDNKSAMFFGIGSNNLRVGLMCFLYGLIGSVFSGVFLVFNGIMVGAFMAFFARHELMWESISTIMIHGALELSAIVIFAAAGMVIGNAWWYPGTYSRMHGLQSGARRALKILIAIVPVIIFAAILESYVTGAYQQLSYVVRWAIILLSFAYIAWYFYFYPNEVAQKNNAI